MNASLQADRLPGADASSMEDRLRRAREEQHAWAARPLHDRLAVLRKMRFALADDADALCDRVTASVPTRRSAAETMSSELIPLLDAIRFVERAAPRLLLPKALGFKGRPAWLFGVASQVHRDPLGVVLIIAPGNFPLFLAGVQAVQAVAAGNAVLIKPAPTGVEAAEAVRDAAVRAGVATDLVQVLDPSVDAAQQAIAARVDHVVLTGSAQTGRAVMRQLAQTLTPSTMELSGCDAAFVREDADLDLVCRALLWGVGLNRGATCIAPRRVLVHEAAADELERRLDRAFGELGPVPVDPPVGARLDELARDAVSGGARRLHGALTGDGDVLPFLIAGATPQMALLKADVFAPVLSLVVVKDDDAALAADEACPYALGASVFGAPAGARELAQRVDAGVVSVNDLILPTADPRLPFGGRGESGFGVTRGGAGLLAMTRPRAVTVSGGRFRPHYDEPGDAEAQLLSNYVAAAHGRRLGRRLAAGWRMARAMIRINRTRRSRG